MNIARSRPQRHRLQSLRNQTKLTGAVASFMLITRRRPPVKMLSMLGPAMIRAHVGTIIKAAQITVRG